MFFLFLQQLVIFDISYSGESGENKSKFIGSGSCRDWKTMIADIFWKRIVEIPMESTNNYQNLSQRDSKRMIIDFFGTRCDMTFFKFDRRTTFRE